MISYLKSHFYNFDWLMFSSVILLSSFGLLQLYSIALGQDQANFSIFYRQLFFVLIGIILLFFFSLLNYKWLLSFKNYFYLLSLILLIAVLFFGDTIRGGTRWFSVFGFGVQPSELVKVILILYLSAFFSQLKTKVKTAKHLIISAISTFLLVFLVLIQPDFGTAMILVSIWFIIVLVSGFKRKYFVGILILAIISSAITWFFVFKPYQKERVLSFIDPNRDAQGSTYNISQAVIAFGSGGLVGQGIGFGSQTQLKFLPEAHTDFIISVIAEEMGFFGVMLVLFLYALFFSRCLYVLKFINHDFGTYFIISAMGLIFIQMFIIIGMNIAIVPVVGLALPFISYGGSSILSLFILIGIIENIIIKAKLNY